ncbi:plasmid replication protein RepC [uncultured Litoreibacter sp.]|uniref:plasmid replication protein RepC n=1 Tax=uncultured Litoreibacter sp. TaxID=1392394 RepID=UPI002634BC61|nr:plasmid replication protein RepC [uncultured Litoreibacter sp.]
MKHASQTEFGRPVEVVLNPDQDHCIDKWKALNALTDAAEPYELSHRTLGVLKALMSFLPDRLIHPMPGQAIVFPSNRTLSHRLNGMPDSTLRRHLAALVTAGIVSRHDSPNRKRYARGQRAGQGGIAFGFDLSPIARHSLHLLQTAQSVQQARAELAELRARLGCLRHQLLDAEGPDALTEDTRRALRRKTKKDELELLITQITARLNAAEMSTSDSQNERHIQARSKYNSDSEDHGAQLASPKKTKPQGEPSECLERPSAISLGMVLETCTSFQSYFPEKIRNWSDLALISERLSLMLGIDPPVFHEACATYGVKRASVIIVFMLEKVDSIQNPGGYLRRITQRARNGGVDVHSMLCSLKLSADNEKIV